MARASLLRAASRLLEMLGDTECAVIGGLAVSAHGYVHATRDVDILVTIPLDEARRRLSAQGVSSRISRRDFFEGDFPVLKGSLGRVPFDIVPQIVPLEPDRVQSIKVGALTLRVVDFDTLARLKLKAGSPKDLWDLAILINLDPRRRERAFELAAVSLALTEQLRSYADDPRAKREALERARDVRTSTTARRKKHK